jgi:hypothetical protein
MHKTKYDAILPEIEAQLIWKSTSHIYICNKSYINKFSGINYPINIGAFIKDNKNVLAELYL